MELPPAISTFLDHRQAEYALAPVQADLPPQVALVRAVLLTDRQGMVMALHPAGRLLDLTALKQTLTRHLEPLQDAALALLLRDCAPGAAVPALARYFHVPAAVDDGLRGADLLELPAGSLELRIRVSGETFHRLTGEDARYGDFARPVEDLYEPEPAAEDATPLAGRGDLLERIRHIRELPAMPKVAQRILQLRIDPRARAADLAGLVAMDPGLAAQVLRWASSPYYGYRGRIESVRDAIVRVLGFDTVMGIALGVAVGRSFRVPQGGPLGLNALWRRSVYCSALVGDLARAMPRQRRPTGGLASLAGLFHNFGLLLLGHAFPAEFALLNRTAAVNGHLPVAVVERHVIGVDDPPVGAWLIQSWGLPEEVVVGVRWHNRPDYAGPHRQYAQIVGLANRLLAARGIGAAGAADLVPDPDLPAPLLESLGISAETAWAVLEKTLKEREALESLSQQFAGA